MQFEDAQSFAANAGGHLATLTSEAESEFAFQLIRHGDRFWHKHSSGNQSNGPAIGPFQAEGARDPLGGWVRVTGEPLT